MASWVLIPCLKALFAEFDRIAPSRDHASDGSVGDAAHQEEVSDHNPDETGSVPIHDADKVNEVHAIDVDNNLNESDLTMEKVVQFLLGRCRSGAEKRLRYIIYNRRIWSASSGWVQQTYTGPSPHTEHAHFSGSYDTALEASTASWHLEDIPVALSDSDVNKVADRVLYVLRHSADDLSDSERYKLAVTTADHLAGDSDFLTAVAKAVLVDYKISGTTTGESTFTRNLSQVTADPWAMAMRCDTLGGDPVPEDGVFGCILKELADIREALNITAKP